ncbi:MAG: four helix bundle protein [Bacteroidota bacterium]
MAKDNIVRTKSFAFAIKIVTMYKYLVDHQKEFVLSKQLLRSGTSIGANIREADNAESKADFIHKMSIAQKETDESLYWLELLKETNYLSETEYNSISSDANEILKLVRSIIISSKNNIHRS